MPRKEQACTWRSNPVNSYCGSLFFLERRNQEGFARFQKSADANTRWHEAEGF